MTKVVFPLVACLCAASSLIPSRNALADDQNPVFEVASVKPFETSDLRANISLEPNGKFTARATLRALVAFAWDLRNDAVTGGPGWMDSIVYDIEATPDRPGRPALPQLQQMLQSLLTERFRLQLRHQTRDESLYNLVVAKGGSKLKPSAPDLAPNLNNGRGHLSGRSAPLSDLAKMLAGRVNRVVVDKTGLAGNYDFELNWSPAPGENGAGPGDGPASDADAPALFTALREQLGLRLQPTHGPVEVLAITDAEKPAAN